MVVYRRRRFGRSRFRLRPFTLRRRTGFRKRTFRTNRRKGYSALAVVRRNQTVFKRRGFSNGGGFRRKSFTQRVQAASAKLAGRHIYAHKITYSFTNGTTKPNSLLLGFTSSMTRPDWDDLKTKYSFSDNDKMYVEKVVDLLSFTNTSLATCTLYLYEMSPRRDLDDASVSDLWTAGMIDQGVTTLTEQYFPIWDFFDVTAVTTAYKIDRVRKKMLKPGETWDPKYIRKINREFNYGYLANQPAIGAMRNFTKGYGLIAYGQVVNSNVEPFEDTNLSMLSIGSVNTHKVVFRILQTSQSTIKVNDESSQILMADQRIIADPARYGPYRSTTTHGIPTFPTIGSSLV